MEHASLAAATVAFVGSHLLLSHPLRLGLDGEIGSLRAGRRADVVVWDGDPLETNSAPVLVMIDGVQQPLETRQTKLRDRYRTPGERELPKAYER